MLAAEADDHASVDCVNPRENEARAARGTVEEVELIECANCPRSAYEIGEE